MPEDKSPPTSPPEPQKIDVIFRGGSVTAIGIVLAFSLGFLNNWASLPGTWIPEDLAAVALISGGIIFQVCALAGMLSLNSLEAPVYRRIIRLFIIGLVLVSVGVFVAITGDALGYSRIWFKQ